MIAAAHELVSDHEARLKAEIEELWADNTTIRKRGLRGGTARKQRQLKGNYTKYKDVRAAHGDHFLKHRVEVEQKDLLGRNRLLGLKALRELFQESYDEVKVQLEACQQVIELADYWTHGIPMLKDFLQGSINVEALFQPETLDKIADMEEMVKAFNEEYDKTL